MQFKVGIMFPTACFTQNIIEMQRMTDDAIGHITSPQSVSPTCRIPLFLNTPQNSSQNDSRPMSPEVDDNQNEHSSPCAPRAKFKGAPPASAPKKRGRGKQVNVPS